MRRVSVLVALLFLVSVQGAAAYGLGGTESFCDDLQPNGIGATIDLYGEDNQRGRDNGDYYNGLFVCQGVNIPDLSLIPQDSNDDCHGIFAIDYGNWHDCISSLDFRKVGASNAQVCLYTLPNYSGSKKTLLFTSTVNDISGSWGSSWDDAIDSIRWGPFGGSC
jgi:hypothetical protein